MKSRYRRKPNNHLYHSAHFHKNYKDYFVSMVHGGGSVVQDPESDVRLEVAHSVKTVVMQHLHTDYELVRNAIPQKECLITPVVEFYILELEGQQELEGNGYRYRATIPHYLSRRHNLLCVKVRFGDISIPDSLIMLRKGNPEKEKLPCYQIGRKNITIYCNHFCDVCTSSQKICTSKILVLPFGWIDQDSSNIQSFTKVETYVCSFLYSDKKTPIGNSLQYHLWVYNNNYFHCIKFAFYL